MTIPWHYRCVVLAPTGRPLLWTISNSKSAAIGALLGEWVQLWPFAITQGYRLSWVKEDREE